MANPFAKLMNRLTGAARAALPQSPAVRQFAQSMEIDYQKWHDGVGYDIGVIRSATQDDRAQIEAILVARGVRDWRDAEALAAIGSPRAQALLKSALGSEDFSVAVAVLDYAPNSVSPQARSAVLVSALQRAEFGKGLAEALRAVEKFHPPEVIDALLRGTLHRKPSGAHFAGMLMYLNGQAKTAFDNDLSPFLVRFSGPNREELFRELCAKINVDPNKYLQS
jgi:hypothetical protein